MERRLGRAVIMLEGSRLKKKKKKTYTNRSPSPHHLHLGLGKQTTRILDGTMNSKRGQAHASQRLKNGTLGHDDLVIID